MPSGKETNEFDELKKAVDYLKGIVPKKEGRPRSVRRAEARKRLIPKDYTCPVCSTIVLNSRGWVLNSDSGPKCRSCHYRGLVRGDDA